MALAETANLVVKLSLAGNYGRQLKTAQAGFGKLGATLSQTEGRAYRAGQQIGTGIKNAAKIAAVGVGLLASQVALGLQSLIRLEQATAQTNAVIKSTKSAAGQTAQSVRDLAEKYEALNAIVGDEVIQSGENLLLTFTNIRKDAFEPALKASLDLNTALGRGPDGLTNTVRIVGKALNDPTKGLTALGRVGITFSKKQQARIKQLQKEGKLYEAQGVILAELDKRFGGSFLAQGGTTAGKVAKFTDSIEDLQRALAEALLPTLGNVADALTEFLSDPQTKRDIQKLGQEIAKLFSRENIQKGIDLLKGVVGTIRSIAGPIADIVGTAVKAFTSLPPDIQKLIVGGFAVNKLTGGLLSNIAGGIFGALKAMTVQAGIVYVNGAVGGGGGLPGGGALPGAAGAAGAAGATSIVAAGTVATVTAAAAAVAGTLIAGEMFKGRNSRFESAGLTHAERLAVNYYNADRATQNTIAKRLGYVPTKADADRGNAKLARGLMDSRDELRNTKQAVIETKRETAKGAALTASAIRHMPPPRVNVSVKVGVAATNVVKKYTTIRRYGPVGGSRDGRGASGPLERDF